LLLREGFSMIRIPMVMLLLFFAALCLPPAFADEISWVYSFEAGMKLARETMRPVVVDFWAIWCGPCKQMDIEVYRTAKMVQASKEFVFIQVDIDRDKTSPARYHVQAIPAILFLDPFETVLARKGGYTHAGDMLAAMNLIPRPLEPVRKNFQALAADKNHFEALMGLGAFYRSKGFADAAQEYYTLALKSPRAAEDRAARDDARAALGLLALGRKDYKEARKIFEQACKDCDPKNEAYMLLALGNTYYKMKKVKEARDVFEQVAKRFPETEHGLVAADNLKTMK